MYDEPTCLVAVLGDGTRFINGKKHVKNSSFQVRDVSKLKWAPNCHGGEVKAKVTSEAKRRKQQIKSRAQRFGFSDEDISNANALDHEEEDLDEYSEDMLAHEMSIEELLESMSSFDFNLNTPVRSRSALRSRGSKEDPKNRKFIYQKMSELEKKLLVNWLSAIRNMILSNGELQRLKYLREMEEYCDDIFNRMKSPLSKFSHCIIGPRYSGKTTFLAVLLSKIGERLATNGQWKRNFLFFISFRSVANNLDNLVGLYQSFVNATFVQAELQIPHFKPYAKKVARFFCGVATREIAPIFPKRHAIDKTFRFADIRLSKLADQVQSLFSDTSKFNETIDFIFNFPKEIAKIFDIPEVHYVFDDFEECDIDLFNPYPENKHESPVLLIERFKRLLPTVSFVLCCQNLPHFLSILDSINKESVDIKTKVQLVNIADLPIDPPESRYEVLIQYSDEHTALRVNRDHCQGCIGLIVGWDKLVKLGMIVENNHMLQSKIKMRKQKTAEFTEDDIRVVDYARRFLPKIYSHEELPSSKIFNVSLVDPRT